MIRSNFKWFILLTILAAVGFPTVAEGYRWPLNPGNEQHPVSSTLDERSSGHFHGGIDIADGDEGVPYYAVISGKITGIGTHSVRLANIYLYFHVTPEPGLKVDEWVSTGQRIASGETGANHLHFGDGPYLSEYNPLRSGGISPYSDNLGPTVHWIRLYEDCTDNQLDPLNLPNVRFDIVSYATDAQPGYGGDVPVIIAEGQHPFPFRTR